MGGESQASLNGYASWVLGHVSLEDQVIAYSSLLIRPSPKLKLFEVGKVLKVAEAPQQMREALGAVQPARIKLEPRAQG